MRTAHLLQVWSDVERRICCMERSAYFGRDVYDDQMEDHGHGFIGQVLDRCGALEKKR